MMKIITYAELAIELGVSRPTISRHAASLGVGRRIGTTTILSLPESWRIKKSLAKDKKSLKKQGS